MMEVRMQQPVLPPLLRRVRLVMSLISGTILTRELLVIAGCGNVRGCGRGDEAVAGSIKMPAGEEAKVGARGTWRPALSFEENAS